MVEQHFYSDVKTKKYLNTRSWVAACLRETPPQWHRNHHFSMKRRRVKVLWSQWTYILHDPICFKLQNEDIHLLKVLITAGSLQHNCNNKSLTASDILHQCLQSVYWWWWWWWWWRWLAVVPPLHLSPQTCRHQSTDDIIAIIFIMIGPPELELHARQQHHLSSPVRCSAAAGRDSDLRGESLPLPLLLPLSEHWDVPQTSPALPHWPQSLSH